MAKDRSVLTFRENLLDAESEQNNPQNLADTIFAAAALMERCTESGTTAEDGDHWLEAVRVLCGVPARLMFMPAQLRNIVATPVALALRSTGSLLVGELTKDAVTNACEQWYMIFGLMHEYTLTK